MAIYFKGTLENNSLFLGNKTNVRECLKIILRNKADHRKIFVCCIPFYQPIFPLPNTFYGTSWKYLFSFGHIVINKSTTSGAIYARSSVIFPHRMAYVRLMQ